MHNFLPSFGETLLTVRKYNVAWNQVLIDSVVSKKSSPKLKSNVFTMDNIKYSNYDHMFGGLNEVASHNVEVMIIIGVSVGLCRTWYRWK